MARKKTKKNRHNTTSLTVNLPEYVVKTLNVYEKEGCIEINKFVSDSISNHAEYCEGYYIDSSTTPIKIQLPLSVFGKLIRRVAKIGKSPAKILTEALSYSIANLISEIDAMESYNLDIAQE